MHENRLIGCAKAGAANDRLTPNGRQFRRAEGVCQETVLRSARNTNRSARSLETVLYVLLFLHGLLRTFIPSAHKLTEYHGGRTSIGNPRYGGKSGPRV
jgi:hypothetical protein